LKVSVQRLRRIEEPERLTVPCPKPIEPAQPGVPPKRCGTPMEWRASRVPRFRPWLIEHIYVCPVDGTVSILVERYTH